MLPNPSALPQRDPNSNQHPVWRAYDSALHSAIQMQLGRIKSTEDCAMWSKLDTSLLSPLTPCSIKKLHAYPSLPRRIACTRG